MEARKSKIGYAIVIGILPLWNVWVGIDVIDTGYSLTYFQYIEQVEGMWFFATFLANIIGHLFMQLPFGNTLLGMNIYASLVVCIGGVIMYYQLVKIWNEKIVFWGEVLAICLCWCPNVILYHSLTYILFSLGATFLVMGVIKHKNNYLVIAGILLGVNAFVRLPSNLLEVILILVVWYGGILRKESIKEISQQTLLCISGYLGAVVIGLCFITITYGLAAYSEGIMQMLQSSEEASDYTIFSMIKTIIQYLYEGSKWIIKFMPFIIMAVILQWISKDRFGKIKDSVCICIGILGMYMLSKENFFDRNYYYYHSVFLIYLVLVILVIIFSIYYIVSAKSLFWEKIVALTTLLITGIMPLGTNNHFYANMNNMFFIFPFFLYAIWQFLKATYASKKSMLRGIGSAFIGFLLVAFMQIGLFGVHFIFLDNYGQKERNYTIESMPKGNYMKTHEENGRSLEELYQVLKTKGYLEKSLITYGNIPGLHYYLDMEMVSSVVWPELGTSSATIWERDIDMAKSQKPIIITHSSYIDILERTTLKAKEEILCNYIKNNQYKIVYENESYIVWVQNTL